MLTDESTARGASAFPVKPLLMSVTRRLRRPQPGPGAHGSSASGLKALSWTSSRQTASKSKSCFRAPSGLTDSEDSDNGGNGSPRYSFMAPSGFTGQGLADEITPLNVAKLILPCNQTHPLVTCRLQQRWRRSHKQASCRRSAAASAHTASEGGR